MKYRFASLVVGCVAAVALSSESQAQAAAPAPPIPVGATASVVDAKGTKLGMINFSDTPAGLLVSGSLTGLPEGTHGIHLHTIGKCEGPAYTSAGGHFNPTAAKHGFMTAAGHHAGDMPNIFVPASGASAFQFIVTGVTLTGPTGLLDADGAAVVIHATADDYTTDPAGASGARIACGVITAK